MIVITGATGHLGNVLVRKLVSMNKKVRVLILPGEDIASLRGLEVEKVEGDVRFPDSLRKAFEGAEIVYHCAGIISILVLTGEARLSDLETSFSRPDFVFSSLQELLESLKKL